MMNSPEASTPKPPFLEALSSIKQTLITEDEGKFPTPFHKLAFETLQNFSEAEEKTASFEDIQFKPRGIGIIHSDPETGELEEVALDIKEHLRIGIDRKGNLIIGPSVGYGVGILFRDANITVVKIDPKGNIEQKLRGEQGELEKDEVERRIGDILSAMNKYYDTCKRTLPPLHSAYQQSNKLVRQFILDLLPRFPFNEIRKACGWSTDR